ncbi:murein hydrolase activator EnvC family protein [Solilutibacter silvestris]|uniref:Membrane-bound metallopeptidase n=1 Tax=Solilutibacter silvestris TaxID=1645665 RepID=A0A2K1Q1J2_9GAMM|nr:peptidoglycan DD-metalloendopeptidase family protein [Lysobacter silvestris]PNS08906.1 Membrane-bound metallopeptidase [Lysobacter silvestris]
MSRARLAIAGMLLAMVAVASAQQSQRATEHKLEQVRKEMRAVSSERKEIGGERVDANVDLKDAQRKVGDTSRAVAKTDADIRSQQGSLDALEVKRIELETHLQVQKKSLAALVRQAYLAGDNAPLKVFLSQDRIAEGQRALTNYAYLQRDRSVRIRSISGDLAALKQTRAQIEQKRGELQASRQKQQAQLLQLEQDRKSRATVLAQLDTQYQQHIQREQQLGQNAKALEGLLAQLRAEAARAARERQLAAERARKAAAAEAARIAREQARAEDAARAKGLPPPPPPKRESPKQVVHGPMIQVGGLGWPVSGTLLAGYGGELPEGGASSGLLIAAAAGTPVHAVADGRVVFAEWMNGYGLISIVDHGNGYMSLYAHNDTLLRDVGASVHRGDALASVGTSGGLSRPAVYFELRRNGSPVNPAVWLQKR